MTQVVTDQVINPVNLAVRHSRVYVADSGTSTLSRVGRDGSLHTLASGPAPFDVAGVAVSSNGRRLAYTSTDLTSLNQPNRGALTVLGPYGSSKRVDLGSYEGANNPDGAVHYGAENPNQCSYRALEGAGYPPDYVGTTLSHPYSVAAYGKQSWIVADISGNDLLKVSPNGPISTLAVLPPVPLLITAEIAQAAHIYPCVAGVIYDFQAQPSDVEVGPHRMLYVSTNPNRYFNPVLPPLGQVYRLNPKTGRLTLLASGIAGASNLAVSPKGKVYVVEQPLGRISVLSKGSIKPFRSLPGVVSLEYAHGYLYAGTAATPGSEGTASTPGTIVKIKIKV